MTHNGLKTLWRAKVKTMRREVGCAMRTKGAQPVWGSLLGVLLTEVETGVISYEDPSAAISALKALAMLFVTLVTWSMGHWVTGSLGHFVNLKRSTHEGSGHVRVLGGEVGGDDEA